jgi:gp16 family phage-associated protein
MSNFFSKPPGTPTNAGRPPIRHMAGASSEDERRNPSFVSKLYPDRPIEPISLPSDPDGIPVLPSPTPSEIKRVLKERGVSMAEIARRTGFTRAYVHLVVEGKRHCPKIARLVSEILGVTPIWLWSDYQDSPFKRGPSPKRVHRGFARVGQARHELKKNLKQRGVTITRLAQIVKRSRSTVSAVINRIATAAPTAWAIIHALFDRRREKLFEKFFPDYTPPEPNTITHFLTLFDTGRQHLRPLIV